ncbi:MAG: hypothetical protein OEV42_19095 [Deltaproteobacteria bacterium]|nr:hypothetical protein [Deltaproteobacteria bacterium]
MPKKTFIAKISRPGISGIYRRTRLNSLIDSAKTIPLTWLSAPGGSGKTTAVADYIAANKLPCLWYRLDEGDGDLAGFFYYMGLAVKEANPRKRKAMPLFTPEYMMGPTVFSRRYFEEVARRLPSHTCLVFDDYQLIPETSTFHNVLCEGIKSLSEIMRVIIISRSNPHEAWARLSASNKLKLIGWEDLRVTEKEATGILDHQEQADGIAQRDKLLERGGGWIAGLLLLNKAGELHDGGAIGTGGSIGSDELFNYFAHEVFNRADERMKSILLQTAFVPSFSPQMVETLAGKGSSKYGISNMVKGNFFIEAHGRLKKVFRYHALFRSFLLSRVAEVFNEKEIIRLRGLSAQLLASEGRFEEAAELLVENEAWENLSEIVLTHAGELYFQGRLSLLKSWIDHLSDMTKFNKPWLFYWEGMCLIPFDQTASRNHLSKAFSRFDALKDEAGLITSWSAIIETHIVDFSKIKTIDKWLKIFNKEIEPILEKQKENIKIAAISAYLHALFWRQPPGGDIRRWRKIAEEAIYNSLSPRNIMKLAGALLQPISFTENLHEGRRLISHIEQNFEKKGANPVMIIQYYAMKAMYSGHVGDQVNGMAAFDAGSKIIEDTGIHIFDQMLFLYYAHNVVGLGDKKKLRSALAQLKKIPAPRLLDQAHVDYSMGTILLALDDARGAEVCAEKAFDFTKKTGAPISAGVTMIALGTIKCRLGKYDESLAWFMRARRLAREVNMVSFHSLIYEGYLYFEKGEKNKGVELLKRGLAIGAKEGYVMMPYFDRPFMNRIFSLAIEKNLENDYTKEFIRKNKLLPVSRGATLKDWPWPIKVYTLGSFRIEVDGRPLKEGRKSHHRLIDILKALICLGGSNVPAYCLADIFWPEKDGDAAQSALDMGIHRLRKLLNYSEAIEVKHGELSINSKVCWVDALAFLELAKHNNDKEKNTTQSAEDMENLLSLYGGKLLPALDGSEWTMAMRENLQSSYLKILANLGDLREASKEWGSALDCYSQGVKVNPLSEEHVRGLMRTFTALGRPVDAILAYQKFEKELKNNIAIVPSPATKALFKEISSSS